MVRVAAGAALACFMAAGLIACGPPPPVVTPAASPSAPLAPAPAASATVVSAAPEALPPMHPCVPTFIQRQLHACEPGAAPVDYSAVANAMAAMTSAGPNGPRPREKTPVPRELEPLEEKAESAARAFLCNQPPGDPDDDHTTTAFDLGRLYFAANHFEEASVFLRDAVLLDPQKHAEVEYAARFLLDSMKALAQSRPECAESFPALLLAVNTHVCTGPGANDRAESCAAIEKMHAPTP